MGRLIIILIPMIIGCGAESPKSIASRRSDNITQYIYAQPYGSGLTYQEKQDLQLKIKTEIEEAILEAESPQ